MTRVKHVMTRGRWIEGDDAGETSSGGKVPAGEGSGSSGQEVIPSNAGGSGSTISPAWKAIRMPIFASASRSPRIGRQTEFRLR